jgi:protein gp37
VSTSTAIQWTDYSWSPWWGCTPVSPGCANCYAAKWAKFTRGLEYRKGVPRQRAKDWKTPEKWNRLAGAQVTKAAVKGGTYRKPHVFPSMCDPFDPEVTVQWLSDFMDLIAHTPHLTWLILTKRPEFVMPRWKQVCAHWDRDSEQLLPNIWLGASVENQEQANKRIPVLLSIPAGVRFLSVEPMLERVDLSLMIDCQGDEWRKVDWAIFGGESGPNARPCNIEWIRDGVRQCRAAKVAPYVKQAGSNIASRLSEDWPEGTDWMDSGNYPDQIHVKLKHPKGGDMAEWPEDLRVREFPTT